ncbi:hypothetical protein P692DRAFT_20849949 [Suillus brevipes Sb2]|nr:hypothetical protein P692DRAFT_20849949 [Suillus brevipes Sb2]
MSYWYGKVAQIYLKQRTGTHDVWLEIQWYYRRVDLEDVGVDLATSMGDYELVLSNHKSFVDMTCVEDHAIILKYDEGDLKQHQMPSNTPYHRWNIKITFCRCDTCDRLLYNPTVSQRYCRKCKQWFNNICLDTMGRRVDRIPEARIPSMYGDIEWEQEFLDLLTIPICRGGPYGVVGNGSIYSRTKSLLRHARTHGELPERWDDILTEADVLQGKDMWYYMCPTCVDVFC